MQRRFLKYAYLALAIFERPSPIWRFPKIRVLGFGLGTAPSQQQSVLGVLLRAIYNHIIIGIQLLLKGGSTEGVGFQGLGF